jgi:dipeptide/tripeptide permease
MADADEVLPPQVIPVPPPQPSTRIALEDAKPNVEKATAKPTKPRGRKLPRPQRNGNRHADHDGSFWGGHAPKLPSSNTTAETGLNKVYLCMGTLLAGPTAWRLVFSQLLGATLRRIGKGVESFKKLRGSPRELWIILLLKIVESCAYFAIALTFVTFLSLEFGYSDFEAGAAYGMWGVATSLFGLPMSFVMDRLGVRRALILGAALNVVGRSMMAAATEYVFASFVMFVLMPAGMALTIPVLLVAVKRYTTPENRSLVYALFYTAMNVGALASGPFVDVMNALFLDGTPVPFTVATRASSLRLIYLVSAALSVVYLLVAMFCVRNVYVDAHGNIVEGAPPVASSTPNDNATVAVEEKHVSCGRWFLQGIRSLGASALATLRAARHDPMFWRLVVVTSALTFVNLLFRHLDATLPKYLVRVFGPTVPYGSIYAINPLFIVIAAPVVTALTSDLDIYNVVVAGSAIAASSVWFIVIWPSSLSAVSLFVLTLSLGEVLYSPPCYNIALSLSPNGREGAYTMLASAPLFLSKFLVGIMSGGLLDSYCPDVDGEQNNNVEMAADASTIPFDEDGVGSFVPVTAAPTTTSTDMPVETACWMIWFIIFCVSIISPIILLVFRRCVYTDAVKAAIKNNQSPSDTAATPTTTSSVENGHAHGNGSPRTKFSIDAEDDDEEPLDDTKSDVVHRARNVPLDEDEAALEMMVNTR